jgi:hypothetical protein
VDFVAGPRWSLDPCPPHPFVLRGQLASGGSAPTRSWSRVHGVVGDVGSVVAVAPGPAGARARAVALALCCPGATGLLARVSAAWVWTGSEDLRPGRVDLVTGEGAPPLPWPRRTGPPTGITLRPVVPVTAEDPVRLGGVAVTGPEATAADCVRTLPPERARHCLDLLVGATGIDTHRVAALVRAGPSRPGRQLALTLLARAG